MRRLTAYNFLPLNGFFKGPNEDITWHQHREEQAKYSEESLAADNILLFGRKTYEMMAGFWPTPMAAEMFPKVAEGMNRAEKIVFSNTITKASWPATRIVNGDIVEHVRTLKAAPGKDMTILGSGTILSLFTEHGLIDGYQFMIDPVPLPEGVPVFHGMKRKINLRLTNSKVFHNGIVLLEYQPIHSG
jgi:dihydrofolate reductase